MVSPYLRSKSSTIQIPGQCSLSRWLRSGSAQVLVQHKETSLPKKRLPSRMRINNCPPGIRLTDGENHNSGMVSESDLSCATQKESGSPHQFSQEYLESGR